MRVKNYNLFTCFLVFVFALTSVFTNKTIAQTTITTETGTNFTGANGVTGNGAITFVVENTNAFPITLTQVDAFFNPAVITGVSGTIPTLWYSTTSLSGAPTIATPTWTALATGPAITIPTAGYYPALTGLSLSIPAGTSYRFALQSTLGVSYSGAAGPPAPNTFTGGGVNLKVYDAQIAALNIGYGGAFPSPPNNPRAFTGRITFTVPPPPSVCSIIGAGAANTNGSGADPIDGFYNGLHYQTLYTAAELTAAGLGAGSAITSLGWSISEDYGGGNLGNYTVRLGHTTATNCATHNTAATTQVINPFSYNPTPTAAGAFDMIPFNTNFVWNGTSNLLIDICTGATNPFTSPYGGVRSDAVTSGAIFARADGTGATTICAAPTGVSSTNVFSFGVLATRPQVRFCYTASTCTNVALTAQPADATITCGGNTTFAVAATGTSPVYQWKVNTGAGFVNVTNGGVYAGATTNTLTLTGVPQSYSGYQYQCVVTNSCPSSVTSNIANLTVNQIAGPSVVPNPATTCLGTTTPLDITTAGAYGAPVTVTFNSAAALGLVIVDGVVAGVNNSINVTGIPAGALISKVDVKLNVTHTWVSDMEVVLKAPNGQILNLSNLCSGTNQSGANFTNTIFSSAGVNAVSTGVRPGYTGTWKADAAPAGGGAFGVPAGPTGFLPTTTTWAPLYTTPNGAWTCAMYDAGPPDAGTFDNWSISITYAPPVPFAGTWTPNAGLFTNAAGTTAYTGTALSTVYANPAASTSYQVTYTNGAGCLSLPTTVPVTVNVPIAITSQPVSTKTCDVQGSTTFKVTVTGTTPTYQWQVFNNVAWTNVTNGVNYAGATTPTLTVTQAPIAWNGFKYRCIVSGTSPCGPVTSDGLAVLTVNPIPVITTTVSPYRNLFPGLTTTLSSSSVPTAASYAWFRNGAAAGTTASVVADVDKMGDYVVTITDVNGCVNSSNIITIADSLNGKVFIYPSPNKGQFQVRYYSIAKNVLPRNLTIYDEKGKQVLTQTYTIGRPYDRMDVDLRNHGKGIYRVELSDRNGKRLAVGSAVVL